MSKIQVLDREVFTQIAAGEVVEKPASIVKELVENSIDAGSKNIVIEIKNGGLSYISIQDDGEGMTEENLQLCVLPHATSKLKKFEDLSTLNTMGFRGEALSSICAVSNLCVTSKTKDSEIGTKLCFSSTNLQSKESVSCNTGTTFEIYDLFFNTPARKKFLRKEKTEENDITNFVEKLMLSHNQINFKYIIDGKVKYNTTNCGLYDTIYTIYGKEMAENLLAVEYSQNGIVVSGYICKPQFAKSNRTYQTLFVNQRYCVNTMVNMAVSNAYADFLMKGKFAFYVLFVSQDQGLIDVNVHPNKLEVKFANSSSVFSAVNNAIYKSLYDSVQFSSLNLNGKNEDDLENKNQNTNVFCDQQQQQNNFAKVENVFENENKNINSFQQAENVFENENCQNVESKGSEENTVLGYKKSIFDKSQNQEDDVKFFEPNPLNFEQSSMIKNSAIENNDIAQSKIIAHNKVIGSVFSTYIIVENGNSFYLIDQHAAHERILFDKFVLEYKTNNVAKQMLLVPYVMQLNNDEFEFLNSNLNILNECGFVLSEFGNNIMKVEEVPYILNSINLKQYFDEVLSCLVKVKKPQDILKDNFATMACKAAVKGGSQLNNFEIETLLKLFEENNNVLQCPHGRPVVVEFTKQQIEKMFKRIV